MELYCHILTHLQQYANSSNNSNVQTQYYHPNHFLPVYWTGNLYKDEKMKEKTSVGLSGRTFSHMKACAIHPVLTSFEAFMATIPYTIGITPSRWCKAISTMLLRPSLSILVKGYAPYYYWRLISSSTIRN